MLGEMKNYEPNLATSPKGGRAEAGLIYSIERSLATARKNETRHKEEKEECVTRRAREPVHSPSVVHTQHQWLTPTLLRATFDRS